MEATAINEFLESCAGFKSKFSLFVVHLKRKDYPTTRLVAQATLNLLNEYVRLSDWENPVISLLRLRGLGRKLTIASPLDFVVSCMVRRVLFLLREELAKGSRLRKRRSSLDLDASEDEDSGLPSVRDLVTRNEELDSSLFASFGRLSAGPGFCSTPTPPTTTSSSRVSGKKWGNLKKTMMQNMADLQEEVDNVQDPISKLSLDYIHAREVVLVYGYSKAILAFLGNAREHIDNFEVYVAETSKSASGHRMAVELAQLRVDTTVITDSSIFALMSRVNKVLIPAISIMANGGVVSEVGTNMVATAAKFYSVPLVCVTELYKLCPLHPSNQDSFNELLSPGNACPFTVVPSYVEVVAPAYDYLAPDKLTLMISDAGVFQPSYIYRLLAEYYSPLDMLTEGVPQLDF